MNLELIPSHPYNVEMLDAVRPKGHINPTPDGTYNMLIIGGGSAGLTAAAGAAGLGGKVALVEKNALGGDCLLVGCVPSKAIIHAAKVVADLRKAEKYGVTVSETPTVDFGKVMEHVYHARNAIAPHDSAERFINMGVDLFFGAGQFTGPNSFEIDGKTIHFKKALIATGSRPREIPIPGLAEAGYLTNETLWNLTEQPESLAVIGAGPIGAELAQSFARLGTRVTLVDIAPQILPREDREAAEVVQRVLQREGVQLCLGAKTTQISAENGVKRITLDSAEHGTHTIEVSEILLAVGRTPNVEGLNLEAAGVDYDKKSIKVDDLLRTTNSAIYAAGDVSMKYQFTHAAGHAGAIVVQNALFPAPKRKLSSLVMPWATYTDPGIAHVGLYPEEAAAQGIEIDTYTEYLASNDRAIADDETEGFVKVHTVKGKGTIVGATIVARHAGELISEITLAMTQKIDLGKLTSVIHPYPTQAEAIFGTASAYRKTKLTPTAANVMDRWMTFSRR